MTNIAELLKDAPKGMKLYSPLLGEVEFAEVMDTDYVPIRVMKRGYGSRFDEYGRYMGNEYPDSECLLFPSKDCRTWEGWKTPVKPNFKVGDWVVRKDGTTFYGGNYAEQITLIESDGYLRCIWLSSTTWLRDNDIRLWTIQDAKDGDVLATDNGWTCIFKAFDGCVFSSYCFMDSQKWFCEFGSEGHTMDSRINGNIHPATKEQRDLLFAKMKEAGYEWNADKKELRKIQSHYDIANFKPFDKVLVRDSNSLNGRLIYSVILMMVLYVQEVFLAVSASPLRATSICLGLLICAQKNILTGNWLNYED